MKQSRVRGVKKGLDIFWELDAFKSGHELVIGTDEAGRGPLAGPVVAAAVAVVDFFDCGASTKYIFDNVNDSKKLTASKRQELYDLMIGNKNFLCASAVVSHKVIDSINIFRSSKLAMKRAVYKVFAKAVSMGYGKAVCFVDGNFRIEAPCLQKSFVGGDRKVFSIAAASIIAKVKRDRLMVEFHKRYPDYAFDSNKGYPTKDHVAAIKKIGLSPIHRISFGPCGGAKKKDIIKLKILKNK